MDAQEQACWLLLVFESGLTNRMTNSIIARWCKQHGKTLREFFDSGPQEWQNVCQLKPEIVHRLEVAKEKRVAQGFLVEHLQNDHIRMLTVLDPEYPSLLKGTLDLTHLPAILFAKGDLGILQRRTIAIIGSRKAKEVSLDFTRETSCALAQRGANVISGNARGVDRMAYEGAMSVDEGHTTVVLPHGIHKMSKSQMRSLMLKIESGHILLLSQFHPDAPWTVSRAMERNNVVTGLAQIVIVAESDVKGGTWEGASGALKRNQYVYVRQSDGISLPGNDALVQLGGQVLTWPIEHFEDVLSTLLAKSSKLQQKQQERVTQPEQTALFIS